MWQARSSEHNLRSPEGKAVNANKDKASSQFKSSDFVDLNAFQKRNRGQRWLFFVCAFRGKNVTQLRERQLHSLYKEQQEASATPKKSPGKQTKLQDYEKTAMSMCFRKYQIFDRLSDMCWLICSFFHPGSSLASFFQTCVKSHWSIWPFLLQLLYVFSFLVCPFSILASTSKALQPDLYRECSVQQDFVNPCRAHTFHFPGSLALRIWMDCLLQMVKWSDLERGSNCPLQLKITLWCLRKLGHPLPKTEMTVMTVMVGGCRAQTEIILDKWKHVNAKCPHARLNVSILWRTICFWLLFS